MKRLFLLATCALTLNACSSMIDNQSEEVTMRTPGATNARCIIENEDLKSIAFTDETINLMKSPHDLVVRCQAPGNREKTLHVKRDVNGWVFLNVANGFVPGAAYDYFSRGAFNYPDEFVVSFVGDQVQPYPLPEYHNKDLKHNNEYGSIEYMGPTVAVTEKERMQEPVGLKKKENLYGVTAPSPVEAKRGSNLDSIHRQYNSNVPYDPTEEDK